MCIQTLTYEIYIIQGLGLWCLTPLSIIFQLHRGGQFYWRRKPEYLKKTTDLWQVTDTLYHNVISNTPLLSGIRTHNVSGNRHRLTYDDDTLCNVLSQICFERMDFSGQNMRDTIRCHFRAKYMNIMSVSSCIVYAISEKVTM